MQKQKLTKLAAAVGAFSLTLSVCAVADDHHDHSHQGPSNQVPTSATEWFKVGEQTVLVNKKDVAELRKAKNVILFVGDGM